jgi:hypothetical protein
MRFLNADPIGFAGGSNWYSYAGNSPLLFIDPTGLCPSSNGGGVLFGLFPTWGDYFHQVGQVFLGYADAAVGTAQGMANMAIHPIDTAAGLYNAVRHPVDTYDGMVASFKQNTKTNRGIGKMIGNGLITVAGVGAAATTAKIASTASKTTAITRTAAAKSVFPKNPKALLPELPRTPKGYIEPNSYTRIRPEAHALKPGETFSPRHHGQHYHVEIRLDPAKSWNNPNNVIKVKPPGYVPGEGTGFLPGETFPGL